MDLVAGVVDSVIRKLSELLMAEYNLQKGLPKQIEGLIKDLESAHTVLRDVREVPPQQLDGQVRIWAREVREASYDMEDILDTYLVEVDRPADNKDDLLKRFQKKMTNLFKKSKVRHTIAGAIEDMKKRLKEVADRCERFSVPVALLAPVTKPDPRLADMHKEAAQLIGIENARAELIAMLLSTPHRNGDYSDVCGSGSRSSSKIKIMSVVGVGGLGKTTLSMAVYDELEAQYECRAFVSIGRTPDLAQVFKDIFHVLDKKECEAIRDVRSVQLLVDGLRKFLQNKRMEAQQCRKKRYYNIGFLDPDIINEETIKQWPNRSTKNIFEALMKQDTCSFILLPYNFTFHWILLVIEVNRGRVMVMDPLRKDKKEFQSILDVLEKAWARFVNAQVGIVEGNELQFRHNFPCLRQEQGNNLCGYFICEFIHFFVGPKKITENEFDIMKMAEDLIEPERVRAVQEQLIGFLLDEVISPDGEFYADHRVCVGLLDQDKLNPDQDDEEEAYQKK